MKKIRNCLLTTESGSGIQVYFFPDYGSELGFLRIPDLRFRITNDVNP